MTSRQRRALSLVAAAASLGVVAATLACASYEGTTTFYRPDGSVYAVVEETAKASGLSSATRAESGCYDHTTHAWTDDGALDDGKAGHRATILYGNGKCLLVRGGAVSDQAVNGAAAVGGFALGKAGVP